jgi:hypothetical protein
LKPLYSSQTNKEATALDTDQPVAASRTFGAVGFPQNRLMEPLDRSGPPFGATGELMRVGAVFLF